MISGFSPYLLKLVLSGQELTCDGQKEGGNGATRGADEGPTPYETLRMALDDANYDQVRQRIEDVDEL